MQNLDAYYMNVALDYLWAIDDMDHPLVIEALTYRANEGARSLAANDNLAHDDEPSSPSLSVRPFAADDSAIT